MEGTTRDSLRLQIEEIILGSIIIDRKMHEAWLLTPKTFKDPKHKIIFEVMLTMHPTKPIDLVSVTTEVLKVSTAVEPHFVSNLTSRLASSENMGYHVMQLVEIDVREKFVALLGDVCSKEQDINFKAMLQGFIQDVSPDSQDLFNSMDAVYNIMVKNTFPKWIVNKVFQFKTNVDQRINELRVNNINTSLFGYLERMCMGNSEDLQTIRKLKSKYVAYSR